MKYAYYFIDRESFDVVQSIVIPEKTKVFIPGTGFAVESDKYVINRVSDSMPFISLGIFTVMVWLDKSN